MTKKSGLKRHLCLLIVILQLKNGITAILHKPFWSRCGTTDTNGLNAVEPLGRNLVGTLYEMGVGVDTQALVEQYLAVRALASAYKQYQVVPNGEL